MVSVNEAQGEKEHLPPSPFIVSAGRSGTTLLRLMLDFHPDMAIPPETHFIPTAVRIVKAARVKQIKSLRHRRVRASRCRRTGPRRPKHTKAPGREQDEDPRRVFAEVLTSWRTWDDHNVGEEKLRERLAGIEPFSLSAGLRTFYGLYAERFGKARWGDKTPNYAGSMGLIQQVLPEARFVYLIRDGRDVALSIKDLWFGPDSIEEAAAWWRSRVLDARAQAGRPPYPRYMEVRYEDLISEPESVLKKVCAFVDLAWNPRMLEYHMLADERIKEIGRDVVAPDGRRTIGAREREGIFALTEKPPQGSRIGRWRREMDEADRLRFEETAGDLLEDLGYPLGGRSGRATR